MVEVVGGKVYAKECWWSNVRYFYWPTDLFIDELCPFLNKEAPHIYKRASHTDPYHL